MVPQGASGGLTGVAAINYYEHHLGDYVRDTTNLAMVEDGAYRRLMDAYYAREKALPPDVAECQRLARAVSKVERAAVSYVLDQFFTLKEDGYHQKRIDTEIARFAEKRAKAKASSVLGVKARQAKPNGQPNGQPNGHESGYSREPNGAPNDQPDGQRSVNLSSLQSPVSSLQSEDLTPLPPLERGVSSREGTRAERNAAKDAAQAVWDQLIASDGAQPPRDSKLQAAIDAVGGWTRIAMREGGLGTITLRKQFLDAYRSQHA